MARRKSVASHQVLIDAVLSGTTHDLAVVLEPRVPDLDFTGSEKSSTIFNGSRPRSLLMLAVETGELDKVMMLVTAGADVNFVVRNYGTALMHAVRKQKLELVNYFLSLSVIDMNCCVYCDGDDVEENFSDISALSLALHRSSEPAGMNILAALLNDSRVNLSVLDGMQLKLLIKVDHDLLRNLASKIAECFLRRAKLFWGVGTECHDLLFFIPLLHDSPAMDFIVVDDKSSHLHGLTFFQCLLFIVLAKNRGEYLYPPIGGSVEDSLGGLPSLLRRLTVTPYAGMTTTFINTVMWNGKTFLQWLLTVYLGLRLQSNITVDMQFNTDRDTWFCQQGKKRQQIRENLMSALLDFLMLLVNAGAMFTEEHLQQVMLSSLDCCHASRHDERLLSFILSCGVQATEAIAASINSTPVEIIDHEFSFTGLDGCHWRSSFGMYACYLTFYEEHPDIGGQRTALLKNPPMAHDVVLNRCLNDFFSADLKESAARRHAAPGIAFVEHWVCLSREQQDGFFLFCAREPARFFVLLGLLRRDIFPLNSSCFVAINDGLERYADASYAREAMAALEREHPNNVLRDVFLAMREEKRVGAPPKAKETGRGLFSGLFGRGAPAPGDAAGVGSSARPVDADIIMLANKKKLQTKPGVTLQAGADEQSAPTSGGAGGPAPARKPSL